MKVFSLILFGLSLTSPALTQDNATTHKQVMDWLTPPAGQQTIGDAHGDIAVANDGKVYVSIMGQPSGIQIYSETGKYIGNLPNAPDDFHGFRLHTDRNGQEYLYGTSLGGQRILKMTLSGEIILDIDALAVIPADLQTLRKDVRQVRLTGIAITADDQIFITDGYRSSFIHHLDASGKYIKSFGGRKAPYNFKTCHKIIIDPRFSKERIICTDRENGRLVHMDLNGEILDTTTGLRRPSALAIYGQDLAVAELAGRVVVLDMKGNIKTSLGANENPKQYSTPKVAPQDWRADLVTSPHGIAYDSKGNILVTEWNKWGRVLFLKKISR